MIRIVDCGSQLTQNIARRIRELGVFTEIIPFDTPSSDVLNNGLEGIIISGGQFSVYDENAPSISKELLSTRIPVLGICYGQQIITHQLGGRVHSSKNREYGQTRISIQDSPLFKDIKDKEIDVWMSHGDIVDEMPKGFEAVAQSQSGHISAMQRENVYAVQFHPEVDHTENGRRILENFLEICNAQKTWNPTEDYDRIIEKTKEKIKEKIGVGGISGGVDSSVASVIIKQIAGENYHPIFVDNGLLRLNEALQVMESLEPFGLGIQFVDASQRFLGKLEGVVDPDKKREIIGHEFIYVFEEEAERIGNVSYLVQGTLYPDVIESVPIYGSSSRIKRHHNVGGLPEAMGLEVVEPFRNLFKDEVRKIAEERLGMPREIVWRHPFPGPGLAIRIVGSDVTPGKLRIVREADDIFIEELRQRGLYYKIGQAFAGLLGGNAVGVMGDAGTYEGMIGLRAITTNDFMTSDWYDFNKKDLTAITNRIINQVRGVNRVFYDTSQKPPATIEWE